MPPKTYSCPICYNKFTDYYAFSAHYANCQYHQQQTEINANPYLSQQSRALAQQTALQQYNTNLAVSNAQQSLAQSMQNAVIYGNGSPSSARGLQELSEVRIVDTPAFKMAKWAKEFFEGSSDTDKHAKSR